MKLRWLPTVLTFAVVGVLLLGGWFGYRALAVEQPLQSAVNAVNGVKSGEPTIGRDVVTVQLQLEPGADLRQVYAQIERDSASVLDGRRLELQFAEAGDALEALWSTALFDVAEAMESHAYSRIPEAMEELERQHQGVRIETQMDAHNVYITMTDEQSAKYIVLPRMPQQLGVWPNA
ncbi:hypothetical protein IDH44_07945 [Paenibacillus sp. IB182496]|uniref:Uncharacterized protein n=1 Tax=Paenibacillus sabuli TaxID=2772509 RepID=A0A927BST6_9BACL|nr:hypothetical protein [Paenibacillus sabuli]MBD2845120.1 hypothetical protein [Paenibacillus sabuli]